MPSPTGEKYWNAEDTLVVGIVFIFARVAIAIGAPLWALTAAGVACVAGACTVLIGKDRQ